MADHPPRTRLPIPDVPYEGALPLDAKAPDASFPPIEPLRPPAGAPNVLIVLLDDAGTPAGAHQTSRTPSRSLSRKR